MSKPDCGKCGRTFVPDKHHVELRHQWQPPEDPAQRIHLCPGCSNEFRKWLEGDE